jgi:hypothetical protein
MRCIYRGNELYHGFGSWANHKYLDKIKIGNTWRYIYDQTPFTGAKKTPKDAKLEKQHKKELQDPHYYAKKNWNEAKSKRLSENTSLNMKYFKEPFRMANIVKDSGYTKNKNKTKTENREAYDKETKTVEAVVRSANKRASDVFDNIRKSVDLKRDYQINKFSDAVLNLGEKALSVYYSHQAVNKYKKTKKKLTRPTNPSLGDIAREDWKKRQYNKTHPKQKSVGLFDAV